MNLKELRKREGKTQLEMCKMIGLNLSSYSNYENGKGKELPIEVVRSIKSIFGIDIEYVSLETTYSKSNYEKNKCKIIENNKKYRTAHKEKVSEYSKEYYKKNKNKISMWKKEWYKKRKKD